MGSLLVAGWGGVMSATLSATPFGLSRGDGPAGDSGGGARSPMCGRARRWHLEPDRGNPGLDMGGPHPTGRTNATITAAPTLQRRACRPGGVAVTLEFVGVQSVNCFADGGEQVVLADPREQAASRQAGAGRFIGSCHRE